MNTDEILDKAKRLIEERSVYGEFDVTAFRVSRLQSILHEEVRTPEGWILDMVCTKLARVTNDPGNLDHYLDAICYLAQAASFVSTDFSDLDNAPSKRSN